MPDVFKLEELPGPIAVLTFDTPDKKVNTLGRVVLEELGRIVAQLEIRTELHGLLLRSGKPGQFIAGADLNELGALVYLTADQLRDALGGGHALFDRVSNLPFPTVSLIDGPCMGGGTELSLALDERLASNSPKTRIGLPEVTIGLIPGWGGTQRASGRPHRPQVEPETATRRRTTSAGRRSRDSRSWRSSAGAGWASSIWPGTRR